MKEVTVTVLLEIGVICAGARYVSATIPALLIIVSLVQYFYLRTSRQLRVRELEVRSPLFTKFTETANGILHIRAFKWQDTFQRQMYDLLDYAQVPYYNLFCVQRWLTLVLDLTVCALASMLVALAVWYRELTSENAVGLSMLSIVTFSGSLAQLVESWVDLEVTLGAVSRIKSFVLNTPQESDTGCETTIPDQWSSAGTIEFRGVSACYK